MASGMMLWELGVKEKIFEIKKKQNLVIQEQIRSWKGAGDLRDALENTPVCR